MIRQFRGFILLVFSFACWVVPASARDNDALEITPITIGESYIFPSSVLGDEREINVWLPEGYDEGREIAGVVYLLDGGLKQDFEHIAGLAQLGALSWTYETLLVVGIETKDRQHELTPVPTDPRFVTGFPTAGGAADFRRFILDEVKPFIEARYRTGERDILMGESLGGLFVVDSLLQAPDTFDDFIAISPSLWWDGGNLAASARARLDKVPNGDRRLFLAIADEGGMMQIGVDILRAALGDVSSDVIRETYADYSERETHATIYHQAALDAFRAFYAMPEYEYEAAWWMDEFGEPPADEAAAD